MRICARHRIAAGIFVSSFVLAIAPDRACASDSATAPAASATSETAPGRVVPASGLALAASATELPPPASAPKPEVVPPPTLPFREGAVPQGYVVDNGSQVGVWVSGICTFATSWGFATAVAVGADKPLMAVPLAGPFIDAQHDPDSAAGIRALFGGVELIGAGLFVVGLILDDPRFIRSDIAGVKVMPSLSATNIGTQLSMDF